MSTANDEMLSIVREMATLAQRYLAVTTSHGLVRSLIADYLTLGLLESLADDAEEEGGGLVGTPDEVFAALVEAREEAAVFGDDDGYAWQEFTDQVRDAVGRLPI